MSFLSRRIFIELTCGLLVALALATFSDAQTLNGAWSGWMETDDFLGAIRLEIAPSGATVTLYYAGDKRSGDIADLKVDGSDIAFEGKLQPSGKFKGKLAGDRITGTVDILNRTGAVSGHGSWSVSRVSTSAPPAPPPSAGSSEIGLIKPSGKFPIGRRFYFWTDESRGEAITDDPSDHRRVFTQIWYPAVKGSGKTAEYIPREVTPEPSSIPKGVTIHARADAKPEKGRFPLIVFSPGLGSDPLRYAAIIEDLVSHGYVVAAMNHPYDAAPVVWPDGTRIEISKKWRSEVPKDWSADERNKFFDTRRFEWARDASFVVDQVMTLDFADKIDLGRIGLLGHSFGGQAASIVCASDARFKACANLDGLTQGQAMLPTADGKTMSQPFLFFTKVSRVTDTELQMMGMSRQEYLAREQARLKDRWKPGFKKQIADISSGGYLITYPGATHGSFSDGPLTDQKSTEPLSDRLDRIRNIDMYILAFFDQTLKGRRSELLNSPKSGGPVMVEFLKK